MSDITLGVISDTHGDSGALNHAIAAAGKVDIWFHLGDLTNDARTLKKQVSCPVYFVRGNNDMLAEDAAVAYESTYDIAGFRFLLVHGHRHGVSRSLLPLQLRAKQVHADCALFGHIHQKIIENHDNLLMLSPGSPSLPRDGGPSIALIEVKNGILCPRFVSI